METDFTAGPAERAYWRAVRLIALGSLLLAPLFLLATGMAALTLWQAWASGQPVDWQAYWASANMADAAGLWACFGPGLIILVHARLTQVGKVRRAALAADDQQAPLAEHQPADRPTSDVPVGPTVFASFRRRPQRWITLGMVCVVTYPYWASLQTFGHWVSGWPPKTQVPFGAIPLDLYPLGVMLLASISAALAILSIWRAMLAFDMPSAGRLAVDDAALYRLQYGRDQRTVSIRWSDARAFWMLRPSAYWPRSHYQRYALDSGSQLIMWGFSAHTATSAEWDEHNCLCTLITKRTGLPLRDLTDAADEHDAWLNMGAPLLTRRVPRLLRWLVLASAVLDMVLVVLLSLGAWIVQHFL